MSTWLMHILREVSKNSRKYLVQSTIKKLFRYTPLLFGFYGTPAMLKTAIDAVFKGLP